MKQLRLWSRLLLCLHLFVCLVWLYLFHTSSNPPLWTLHVGAWSILAIQFTWGLTVGLIVGPNRKRRSLLWWSLLPVFMPLWVIGPILTILFLAQGPLITMIYLAIFTMILASETFCGVLLGAKFHSDFVND